MRGTIHDDDEQKWIDASRSDPLEFDHLYNRYISRVFRYIFHRLNNHADAEEITSQTFLVALEGMDRYEHRGSFISWLITIARNKLHDYFRRQHPQNELNEEIRASGKSDPLGVVIENEQNRHLIDLISALPQEDQELLRLRFVAELTFAEIATLMGMNESAVKKKIYRIILRLQYQVEENHD
jgi:RNA polymerase sigma-70 factor (ECF subfamily)